MRLLGGFGRGVNESSVRYVRREIPYPELTYRRWPRDIANIRAVLPEHLVASRPPATARRGSWFVVAVLGRTSIGYSWAVPLPGGNVDASSVDAYIEEVAVLADHQGRGIGSRLVKESTRWLGELGFEEVSICPLGSNGWLRRLGFAPIGINMYAPAVSRLVD